MTIMDTLYVLFKGDNTDLKKTAKESEAVVNKVGESFINMARAFTGVVTSALTTASLVAGIKNAADYAQQLDLASRQLNVNVSALDAWGNAVRRTGGSVEGFESSLKGIAAHLGVTNTTALRLLPQLADAFQRMGRIRSQNYGTMLGLDQSTILLLQQGRRAVDDLVARQKELGVVTQRDAEIARKFNFAIQDTSHAFRSMFLAVADTILPVLTKLAESLIPLALYFRQHSDFIVGALIAIGGAATYAAVGMGLISAPVLLAAAAIGLFALAYDDLATFFKGGDSLIGRAFERWPRMLEALKNGFRDFASTFKIFKSLFTGDYDKNEIALKKANVMESDSVTRGAEMLTMAASTPLNAQTSSSIFNTNSPTQAGDINISEITINTQATDADGIAGALKKGISAQLWQAVNNVSDGVVA
jgi:predicted nucleic acid-binding protein